MVPDKFNMVDMGGIDLIMMQGEEVPGLYIRLVESIAQCRYQCLYNWLFDGIIIPPTYVEMEVNEYDEVAINEGVVVTSDDVIHIYSIEPPVPDPEIIPLLAEENGVYNVPTGKDGFNPVTVDVPSYTPVISSISITENGTYNAPSGTDGFNPIVVAVPSSNVLHLDRIPTSEDGEVGDYCITLIPSNPNGFAIRATKVCRGSSSNFSYWGTSAFRVALEDAQGIEHNITELSNYKIWLSPSTITTDMSIINQLFTNSISAQYVERNGLPGYICVTADDIGNYKLKSFSMPRRQGTSFVDYLSSFDLYPLKNNEIYGDPMYSARDLTANDWPNGQMVEFSVNSNWPVSKYLYYKSELGWVQII